MHITAVLLRIMAMLITNYGKNLLEITAKIYYKLRQVLLHITAGIKNRDVITKLKLCQQCQQVILYYCFILPQKLPPRCSGLNF